MGRLLCKGMLNGQEDMGTDGLALFVYEVIAESMWRPMGWVCDERANAVIDTLKIVF